MFSLQYFPGAVQTLHTAGRVGGWDGDTAVFVTDDVSPCARRALAAIATFVIDISQSPWVGMPLGLSTATTTTHYAKLQLFTDTRFRAYDRILYLDADITVRAPLGDLLQYAPEDPRAAVALDVYGQDSLYRELSVPASTLSKAFQNAHPNRPFVHQTNIMWIYMDQLPPPREMKQLFRSYLLCCGHQINRYFEQGLVLFALYNRTVSFASNPAIAHRRVVTTLEHQFHFRLAWHPVAARFAAFATTYAEATADTAQCFVPSVAFGRPPHKYVPSRLSSFSDISRPGFSTTRPRSRSRASSPRCSRCATR